MLPLLLLPFPINLSCKEPTDLKPPVGDQWSHLAHLCAQTGQLVACGLLLELLLKLLPTGQVHIKLFGLFRFDLAPSNTFRLNTGSSTTCARAAHSQTSAANSTRLISTQIGSQS